MRRFLLAAGLLALVAVPALAADQALNLTQAQRQALGVKVGPVKAVTQLPIDGLPATARAPMHESAVVTAPFAGVTVAILAREGTTVKRGQVLAQIRSRERMTLGADLVAARSEYAVAKAQADRDRELLREGIIAGARAQASEARFSAARARLHELQTTASMAPAAAGAAPGTYALRSPLDGRVIERTLRLGEPVAALDKAYIVARAGLVTLEMRVPARYVSRVTPGLEVRASDGATGKVNEVGAMIDSASQTVLVRALVKDEALLPGQQTSATLLLPAPAEAWSLPSEAVVDVDGQSVVFVQRDGRFDVVRVEVLTQTGEGTSVVKAALNKSSQIVVAGAGALKAMLVAGG